MYLFILQLDWIVQLISNLSVQQSENDTACYCVFGEREQASKHTAGHLPGDEASKACRLYCNNLAVKTTTQGLGLPIELLSFSMPLSPGYRHSKERAACLPCLMHGLSFDDLWTFLSPRLSTFVKLGIGRSSRTARLFSVLIAEEMGIAEIWFIGNRDECCFAYRYSLYSLARGC